MPLPSSSTISLSQVNVELTFASNANINMNSAGVRGLFGKASGAISMSDGWGKSSGRKGYWAGGELTFNNYTTATNEIDGCTLTASMTIVNPTAALSTACSYALGALSTSNGYIFGGSTSTSAFLKTVQKLSFSTETLSTLAAIWELYPGLYGGIDSAAVNATTAAYTGAGLAENGRVNRVYSLTFSSEAVTLLSAVLSSTRRGLTGLTAPTKGYFGGGNGAAINSEQIIDALTYSTLTVALLSAVIPDGSLNYNSRWMGGVYSGTAGYFMGGYNWQTVIRKLDYSNETCVNISATMVNGRSYAPGMSGSSVGAIGGGYQGAPLYAASTVIDVFTFATETCSNPGVALTVARSNMAAI